MFRATVTPAWDLDAWRAQARHAWEAGLPPDVVEWQADAQGELLASAAVTDQPARRQGLSVPADFMAFAASVLCHRDAGRHALLYRLLWRIGNGERALLDRATDRIMICGSPEMLRDLKAMCEKHGFEEGSTSRPGDFVIERAFVS